MTKEKERELPLYLQGLPEISKEEWAGLAKLAPKGDRILVKPCEPEKKTKGGIIIPDTAQESSFRGIIVAIGPGHKRDDGTYDRVEAEVGDIIVYGKYSGSEWHPFDSSIEGKFLIMRETDMAVKLGNLIQFQGTI